MSDSSKSIDYQLTADPAQFVQAMEKAAVVTMAATEQIDKQLKKIGDAFSNVQKLMMGFTTVLAGGGALKHFIDETNAWNSEGAKMARQLGLTTEKASVLNVALHHLGIDSDVYVTASEKLSKQVHSNANAFEVMGVKVQEANGQYRPVTEVMTEVNEKLAAIKNPIEQNIAGQQAYGKGWAEVRGIIKLTSEGMTQAEEHARELGLIVGPEGAAMSKKYTEQMRDLNLVGHAMEVQFGNALLPIFARVGAVMSHELPQSASALATALGTVMETLTVLGANIKFVFEGIGREIGAVFAQIATIFTGEGWVGRFTAISAAVKEDGVRARAELDALEKKILGIPEKTAGMGSKAPDFSTWGAAPKAPPHYDFKPEGADGGKDNSRVGGWEAALEERKLAIAEQARAEGTFHEMSKAEELAYWQNIKNTTAMSSTELLAIRKKIATEALGINKGEFDARLESLQVERAEMQKNYGERTAIAVTAYQDTVARYGEESKEAKKAYGDVLAEHRSFVAQSQALDASAADSKRANATARIELDRIEAQSQLALGEITHAQMLQRDRQFEEALYAIKLEGLQARAALIDPAKDPVAADQVNRQIEEVERQHLQRLAQIRAGAVRDDQAYAMQFKTTLESSFASVIKTFATGTMTIQQLFRNMGKAILSSMVDVIAQIVAKWAAGLVAQTLLQKTASKTIVADKAVEAETVVGANAVEAGSGAASALASIPFAGPVLALAAMAAVFAAVKGLGGGSSSSSTPSAEGGWDIPKGLNPMTQLHENEMVLPSKHADVIRSLAEGAPGGGDLTVHVHQNVQALDSIGVRRVLMSNVDAVAEAVKSAHRNFHFT